MFKTCLLTLTLTGLLCAAMAAAVGQDAGNNDQQPPAGGPPEHGRMRMRMDPKSRVEMLTKQLNLTSDQQTKVLDIVKAERTQMENLRDSPLSPPDRHAKMMDIHKESNGKIRALLDADQQKKFDEMQARQQQWMQGHHPGEGMGAPPDASQHAPEQK